jgi:flagellar L-ring protein precursor FlgH
MRRKIFILILLTILFTACSKPNVQPTVSSADYKKEMEEYQKMLASKKTTPSLWSERGTNGNLFLDYKGRQVGDIIIVKIAENASASNSISTSTSKDTKYDLGITSMMGLPLNMGMSNFLGTGNAFNPEVKSSTKNSFSGKGKKSKQDTVTATIATRVVGILPSGNLAIQGQREIVVDQEKQVIRVRGIIRQKDVDADNSVLSTKIANAQISYSGDGVLTDSNKKGWMANAIDWIWPF